MSDSRLRLVLVRLLRLTICPMCGEHKDPGKCFCKTCYFGLTAPQRNLLYTPIDASTGEFEEYYLEAMRYLKSKGHARKLKDWPLEAVKIIAETGFIEVMKERKKRAAEARRQDGRAS